MNGSHKCNKIVFWKLFDQTFMYERRYTNIFLGWSLTYVFCWYGVFLVVVPYDIFTFEHGHIYFALLTVVAPYKEKALFEINILVQYYDNDVKL